MGDQTKFEKLSPEEQAKVMAEIEKQTDYARSRVWPYGAVEVPDREDQKPPIDLTVGDAPPPKTFFTDEEWDGLILYFEMRDDLEEDMRAQAEMFIRASREVKHLELCEQALGEVLSRLTAAITQDSNVARRAMLDAAALISEVLHGRQT